MSRTNVCQKRRSYSKPLPATVVMGCAGFPPEARVLLTGPEADGIAYSRKPTMTPSRVRHFET